MLIERLDIMLGSIGAGFGSCDESPAFESFGSPKADLVFEIEPG
jgi:hypothetical protein